MSSVLVLEKTSWLLKVGFVTNSAASGDGHVREGSGRRPDSRRTLLGTQSCGGPTPLPSASVTPVNAI